MYALGKSTEISVVHQGIDILCERLTPNTILFPMASELQQVMVDFEALCGLPCCTGALDGTFMPIKQPEEFGDTYFLLQEVLCNTGVGMCGCQGDFTYVNAERPGSVGDSYAFRHSLLYETIHSVEWLSHTSTLIEGVYVEPFLVANAAFPLDTGPMSNYKHSFNYVATVSFEQSELWSRLLVD